MHLRRASISRASISERWTADTGQPYSPGAPSSTGDRPDTQGDHPSPGHRAGRRVRALLTGRSRGPHRPGARDRNRAQITAPPDGSIPDPIVRGVLRVGHRVGRSTHRAAGVESSHADHQAHPPSSPARHPGSAPPPRQPWRPRAYRSSGSTWHAGWERAGAPGDGITAASGDVTNAADVAAAVAVAGGSAPLRLAVNCAGIGTAGRVLSRKGAARPGRLQPGHLGQPDRHVQRAATGRRGHRRHRAHRRSGPARADRQHRVDRCVRRADRSDRLLGVQGRRRRDDAARRARPRAVRDPGDDDRPRHSGHPDAGRV